jgi:hypothetical protein
MKTVHCTTIGVDCVANDPVDIRAGGPEYLGFDFSVRTKDYDHMKEFIIDTLLGYEVPIIGIYKAGEKDLPRDRVWTETTIAAEIRKDAAYLKAEAQRNYPNQK